LPVRAPVAPVARVAMAVKVEMVAMVAVIKASEQEAVAELAAVVPDRGIPGKERQAAREEAGARGESRKMARMPVMVVMAAMALTPTVAGSLYLAVL
jgi:hypothetical protein